MKTFNITDPYKLSTPYTTILCDLWGVVHNGNEVLEESRKFLEKVKNDGKQIVLVSNAPRPNFVVAEQLTKKLGLNSNLYDFIVTSGDVTSSFLNTKKYGSSYYHLGPQKDKDLLSTIKLDLVKEVNFAEFVLCTGIDDDESEEPSDYNDILNDMLKSNLLMVCANPDKIVYRGNKKIPCAGALAQHYESIGGKVKYFGKPHVEIYEHIFSNLKNINNKLQKKEILAIGDSLSTDILGAINFNIDVLFIRSGIHKHEINSINDLESTAQDYLVSLPRKLLTSEYL